MPLQTSPESPAPLRDVVNGVRGWVERLGAVWIEAQVVELKAYRSVTFLTLRDPLADVSVTATCPNVVLHRDGPIQPAAQVIAQLRPYVHTRASSLRFECAQLRPSGAGRLLARLEQLRQRLAAEGLFETARKRELPFLPRIVGLITAADSAAERDVVENSRRRWPGVRFARRNVPVQGAQAAAEIVAAISYLDRAADVDVIIIARGGGSLEDLLPFSEENVVRAVAAATTPVVSAIGHETDTPLLDHVADLRASTPTDAARLVLPDSDQERRSIGQLRVRLTRAIEGVLANEQRTLDQLVGRPGLANPLYGFEIRHDQVSALRQRARVAMTTRLRQEAAEVAQQLARVQAMSPMATLQRGYAIITDPAGRTVDSVSSIGADDELTVRLRDGDLRVTVDRVREREQQ